MLRVVVVLSLAALALSCSGGDEPILRHHTYLLGGVVSLSPKVLQSEEVKERVEEALAQLSSQNGGLITHHIIRIRSGTRQVVNGFKYVFVVEVESSPTEGATGAEPVSEVYRVEIYEPASRGAKKQYNFEKIPTNEE
ncbi:unnamed protein product [Taenia asiatica]|uniref:Cystatin domain-containing protein n=1 Tax=Taenia asiatica TaxID=60517 RepID=A0A0R3W741_TAEAS|nr:unnamed protein product [Taenia asiatica]